MDTSEFALLDSTLMGYFVFGLALARMGAMIAVAPLFSAQQITRRVKAGMAVFFSLCCYPVASRTFFWPEGKALNATDITMLVAQEIMIGIVIGFMASVLFTAAHMAGEIVGQQIGFAMANVVDPFSNLNVSVTGFLIAQVVSLLFITLNLHLILIWLLCESYFVVPAGMLQFDPWLLSCLEGFGLQMDLMFEAAIKVAMPIILIMMMASTIIGFVSRTMPQMNIMVLGMPLRIVMGLLALMFLIPGICDEFAGGGMEDIWLFSDDDGLLRKMLSTVAETVEYMAPENAAGGKPPM